MGRVCMFTSLLEIRNYRQVSGRVSTHIVRGRRPSPPSLIFFFLSRSCGFLFHERGRWGASFFLEFVSGNCGHVFVMWGGRIRCLPFLFFPLFSPCQPGIGSISEPAVRQESGAVRAPPPAGIQTPAPVRSSCSVFSLGCLQLNESPPPIRSGEAQDTDAG